MRDDWTTLVPTVESERLVLRGHRRDDFAECAALWADPVVTRYVGGRPFASDEVWTKLLRYVGHWAVVGYGYWVVREKASGRFVGEVGFADFQRDIVPSFDGAPEAGWVLAPWSYGKGFATEAVRAATTWLERALGPVRTVCMIDLGNVASIRVAAKSGFREWTRATYKGTPVLLFERPA
jgi:RimJ/RimL family protein N-acetyltransferase